MANSTTVTDHESQEQHLTNNSHPNGIHVERRFTRSGSMEDALGSVPYEQRSSVITNPDGSPVFRMDNAEVPVSWSQLASDILISKYFRKAGLHGDPDVGEKSVRQVVRRIARTLGNAGTVMGYFASAGDAEDFEAELAYVLVHQLGAFNSPVWFNLGLWHEYEIEGSGGNWAWDEKTGTVVETTNAYERPQCSACFIQSANDDLMSIFELIKSEARLFKYGSGTGSNFSAIRGRQEKLSGGGLSSGLMSFLEVFDRAAGATKSGGATRRAAKMVCLNMDHPEIVDFIGWKSREEKKAQALIASGYSSDFNGDAYHTISGQNSNNSVRVTDEFMKAVDAGSPWQTRFRTSGKAHETLDAKKLWRQIAEAAWSCADPGVQYDSTINDWHTCPNSGRINASNPCCITGDMLVDTSEGLIPFEQIEAMDRGGDALPYVFAFDKTSNLPVLRPIKRAWLAGTTKELVEVQTERGLKLRVTPEHHFLLRAGDYVQAKDLTPGTRLRKIGRAVNEARSGRRFINHRATENAPRGTVWQNRFMWEQAKGEIPPGHHIHHKNENPTDDRLSNFELREGTDHIAEHSDGENNPRFLDVETSVLVEVWEDIESVIEQNRARQTKTYARIVALQAEGLSAARIASRLDEEGIAPERSTSWSAGSVHAALRQGYVGRKEQSVSVQRWNTYVHVHGLEGIVPLANPVRGIQGRTWEEFERFIEQARSEVNDKVVSVTPITLSEPVKVYDMEVEGVHNFAITSPAASAVHSIVVSNSEYMFLDDTACNLASVNLTKFFQADGTFDVDAYRHACRVLFIAQEILVDLSSYPTKPIAQNSHDYRPLGLGYANLGSLLMMMGVPYDSDKGRAIAAALTAIMCGHAYKTSAEMAAIKGPFAGFARNREPMLRVMEKHLAAAKAIAPFAGTLCRAAVEDWTDALQLGEQYGYRNAQATVLAPTGCLVAGTLVPTDQGFMRIETLGDPDGPKWQEIDIGVQTDEGVRRATKFYVNGVDDVIDVHTAYGYRLSGTPKHQIKTVTKDGHWVWKRLDALVPGDRVPLAMEQIVGTPREVVMPSLPPPYRTNAARGVTAPNRIDPILAELAGAFAANGSLHTKGLRFAMAAADRDAVERYAGFLRKLFGVDPKCAPQGEYTSLELHSTQVRDWWQAAGFAKLPGSKPGKGFTAVVPEAVLASNDPAIYGAYLRGVFTCDGTVFSGLPSLTNKDRQFVSDIQTILLALGIPTRLDPQTGGWSGKRTWRLTVASRIFCAPFFAHVGFSAQRKASLVQTAGEWSRADFIPVTEAQLDAICPTGSPHRKDAVRHLHESDGLPRHLVVAILREQPKDTGTGTAAAFRAVERIASFFYDTIESTALAPRQPTFDLSVPSNVTYEANGFVSHNTIGLLMDCDTTGVEPDFALVKFKKLAGGGYFKIVNQTVAPALRRLGYSDHHVQEIVAYISGTNTLATAPHINRRTLKDKGLSDAELTKVEDALPGVFDLDSAFASWIVGDETYDRLGITKEARARKGFSLLEHLGFTRAQIDEAGDIIVGRMTIEGAPHVIDEDYKVFDCANRCGKKGKRFLHPMSHLHMMSAVQPFLSGAISKTVNLPNEATVEEVETIYKAGWQLGLKAVALYRDGCKASQPLSTGSEKKKDEKGELLLAPMPASAETAPQLSLNIAPNTRLYGQRARLPHKRRGFTQEAVVGGHKLFVRTGEYDDGQLGEIFIDMHKEGATFRSLMNCFAMSVSVGLQYGVPLQTYVDQFTFTRFEPQGPVQGHPYVKFATSLVDFIFRALGVEYLHRYELAQVKPEGEVPAPPASAKAIEMAPPTRPVIDTAANGRSALDTQLDGMSGDAPVCDQCGHITVRNGACYRCLNCGNSMGCS